MMKVGDRVTVVMRGAPRTGTSLGPGTITIAPGKSISVGGRIEEDRGAHWLVVLDTSFDGKNTLLISKKANGEKADGG